MPFEIETTSYCENGISPRWVWWVRGIGDTQRFGLVGTDEQGQGLFLYEHEGDRQPRRETLIPPSEFTMPGDCSKHEANETLRAKLRALGWRYPGSAPD